jgi:hypothetical protein
MTTAAAGLFLSPIAFLFPSLVQQGAQTFVQIRYPEATRDYSTALNGSSDSAIVLWRLARVYSCRADISLPDAKLDLYRQAEDLAHRCIEVDSTIPEGHVWRAAVLGNIAMFEGGKTMIGLCYMAPGNVSWFERRLAAIFLGTLPERGYAESAMALPKAIALAPTVIRHHFEPGVLYMQLDRAREAVEELRLVQSLPVRVASDQGPAPALRGLKIDVSYRYCSKTRRK